MPPMCLKCSETFNAKSLNIYQNLAHNQNQVSVDQQSRILSAANGVLQQNVVQQLQQHQLHQHQVPHNHNPHQQQQSSMLAHHDPQGHSSQLLPANLSTTNPVPNGDTQTVNTFK